MRRLTNVEYNNTVRDLTGVDLRPAREFPADGAAGEGFTNVGDALVMSPSMLDKYLAAAKGIAAHAVLLPDGFRFSEKTTRPDWSEEILTEIRQIYRVYTDPGGARRSISRAWCGTPIPADASRWRNTWRRPSPIATHPLPAKGVRRDLGRGVAEPEVSANAMDSAQPPEFFCPIAERLRAMAKSPAGGCRRTGRRDPPMASRLTRFKSVGHFKPWQEDVNPLAESQTFRVKLCPAPGARRSSCGSSRGMPATVANTISCSGKSHDWNRQDTRRFSCTTCAAVCARTRRDSQPAKTPVRRRLSGPCISLAKTRSGMPPSRRV